MAATVTSTGAIGIVSIRTSLCRGDDAWRCGLVPAPNKQEGHLSGGLLVCGCVVPGSVRTVSRNHDADRPPQDAEVGPKRPVPHVLRVQINPLLIGQLVAPADLPQTRKARFHRTVFGPPISIEFL